MQAEEKRQEKSTHDKIVKKMENGVINHCCVNESSVTNKFPR